jgi:hypothetical protein
VQQLWWPKCGGWLHSLCYNRRDSKKTVLETEACCNYLLENFNPTTENDRSWACPTSLQRQIRKIKNVIKLRSNSHVKGVLINFVTPTSKCYLQLDLAKANYRCFDLLFTLLNFKLPCAMGRNRMMRCLLRPCQSYNQLQWLFMWKMYL